MGLPKPKIMLLSQKVKILDHSKVTRFFRFKSRPRLSTSMGKRRDGAASKKLSNFLWFWPHPCRYFDENLRPLRMMYCRTPGQISSNSGHFWSICDTLKWDDQNGRKIQAPENFPIFRGSISLEVLHRILPFFVWAILYICSIQGSKGFVIGLILS